MTFRWDGGFIMVSWDNFEEGVSWYTSHMGWKCLDQVITPVGKKAFLKMPRSGVVTLKSFESNLEHFQASSGYEGHVRLCFETVDLEETLAYFQKAGIRVSDLITLPSGEVSFDIFAFENARLTAVHNPKQDGKFPGVRIPAFSEVNMRIGVTDIQKAADWYQDNLGLKLVQLNRDYAHMQVEDAYDWMQLNQIFYDNILLEEVQTEGYEKGSPSIRNYFDLRPEVFFETYEKLKQKGLDPSEIAGDPRKGWAGFHFYDLDGNQINIWSYPQR